MGFLRFPSLMSSSFPYTVTFRCPVKWEVHTFHVNGTAVDIADLESQLLNHFKECNDGFTMSMIWTMLAQEPKKSEPNYSYSNFLHYLQHYCVNYGEFDDGTRFMESSAFIDGHWTKDPVGAGEHFYERASRVVV